MPRSVAIVAAMIPSYPDVPAWMLIASLVYPLFYTVVSTVEYRRRQV